MIGNNAVKLLNKCIFFVAVHYVIYSVEQLSDVSVFWHEIEQLLEFLHQLPAFANMTMSVRRDLCGVMVFEVVEQANTILLHHKQEVGPPSSPSLFFFSFFHFL